jgi:hypothetical protein
VLRRRVALTSALQDLAKHQVAADDRYDAAQNRGQSGVFSEREVQILRVPHGGRWWPQKL